MNGESSGVSRRPASLVVLPGAIAFTLIFSRPSWRASVVVRPTSASLLTPYTDTAGKAPPDTWLTIVPPPRWRISGTIAFAQFSARDVHVHDAIPFLERDVDGRGALELGHQRGIERILAAANHHGERARPRGRDRDASRRPRRCNRTTTSRAACVVRAPARRAVRSAVRCRCEGVPWDRADRPP